MRPRSRGPSPARLAGAGLFAALLAARAAPAAEPRPIRAGDDGVTLGVAAGWVWTDPSENLDSTWVLVPRLGYAVSEHFTLETDLGLMQGQTRSWGYGYDGLTPRENVLLDLAPRAALEPFIVLGGGIIWKHVRRDPDTWSTQPPEGENIGNYKNPDIDFLPNLGYGAYVRLGGGMCLRVDFRGLLNLGTEPHGEIADTFVDWELTAGLVYRDALRRRDIDGDGIVDRYDDCVEDPEDYDGFEDTDGCPDDDNDGDGILDAYDDCRDDAEDFDGYRDDDGCPEDDNDNDGLADWDDACPDTPEDRDNYRDEDGCPEDDNDKDGVLDVDDRCPNVPEDGDGFDDWDGCPDDDNDHDGITDYQDVCPDAAESWNGFEDQDGCPDEKPPEPPPIEKFTGVIEGINFKVDSDEITVDSYHILNEAAAVLLEYPNLRIEVQGHTDSDGSEEYNLDLSARRAKAVVDYLIGRGVPPERLEWVGYGESRPLVPEKGPDSKAVNRRVEFHIIEDGTASDP